MPYNKVYTVLILVLFISFNSKSVAQVGQNGEDWKYSITKDSSLFFISISQKSSLLTLNVRSRKNGTVASMLYYLDSLESIEKIYLSSFNAINQQFLDFVEATHTYHCIGMRVYSDKRIIYELRDNENINQAGFAYYERGLMTFTTQPKAEKLKGDYIFKERTR